MAALPVVARSPDLATRRTEGLRFSEAEETVVPADGGVRRPAPKKETVGPAPGGVRRPAPNESGGDFRLIS
jgi:hypothetical protein